MEYSLLKFTFFLAFIKYLLTKTCFPIYPFSVHCGKECITIFLIAWSPSFLPSQFHFLSVCDAMPQVRSWLMVCRPGLGSGRFLADATWLLSHAERGTHVLLAESGSYGANCCSVLSLVSGACNTLCSTSGYTVHMVTEVFRGGDMTWCKGSLPGRALELASHAASALLGDVRLSLFPSSNSYINIVICTEVFIKVNFMNVRMMIIWLSLILLKCLLTWNTFFLFRGLKDNLVRLFLPSKAISHLPWLDVKLFSSITALLACHSYYQRTSKRMLWCTDGLLPAGV